VHHVGNKCIVSWTDTVVTLVIRDEKPATDVYPICRTAQTHPVSRRLRERR